MDRFVLMMVLIAGLLIGWTVTARLSKSDVYVLPPSQIGLIDISRACVGNVVIIPTGGALADDICK